MKLCYHCMHQLSNENAHTCPRCGRSMKPQSQPERFLQPGTVLGRKFVVGDPLGAGGFGNTYIGWDQLLQRKIAVKEFYPEQYCKREGPLVTVPEEGLRPRFQRGLQQFLEEARNVAALHEVQGVVEISNFFEENGTGYIVMEYLEGMDVKTILEKSGNAKEYEWCRRVILTVLYTLKEVHKRGVLHRDIAPDNIFVTDEGIIKLIDFGAAKHASALENTADIMLKTGYAPIEQYSKNLEQGRYTDLYAVAALFYRMVTGQKPIPAHQRLEDETLITPSEMGISIPEQAEMAMMVCLNMMPEYRLQSAEEFMEALDGKYFIPTYEPEWILPNVEEKKGILGKLQDLPAAAKAAACFAGICLAGAAAFGIFRLAQGGQASGLENEAVVMQDFRGRTKEDVDKYLEELNDAHPGWNLTAETEDPVFDLAQEHGAVCTQSVEAGSILYDPDSENPQTAGSLSCDGEGNVSGTILLRLYSKETISYHEISGLNAYELAQKLQIDTDDSSRFIKADSRKGKNYFDLAAIESGGKKISAASLKKKKNQAKELTYRDDIKIYYYASDFFYWKKLPDFTTYGSVDETPQQPIYRYTDEETREKAGERSIKDGGLVDDSYWAIGSPDDCKGKIIGQTVAPGTKYDGSHPPDTVLQIQAVGNVLEYQGKTGKAFAKELEEQGFEQYGFIRQSRDLADGNTKIVKVEAYRLNGDMQVEYFQTPQKGDDIYFMITVEDPVVHVPAPKPAPTPAPAPAEDHFIDSPSRNDDSSGRISN